jgi:hypothetical protein
MVPDQQNKITAGSSSLSAQIPQRAQHSQRRIATVDHVPYLHHRHPAACPPPRGVGRATQCQRRQRMLDVAVEIADAAHGPRPGVRSQLGRCC